MAKLISICPRCKTKNEVINTIYMRLDGYTTVICANCSLRFRALLNDEDISKLFQDDSISPVVTTEEDYNLKSEFIKF